MVCLFWTEHGNICCMRSELLILKRLAGSFYEMSAMKGSIKDSMKGNSFDTITQGHEI